MGPGSFRTQFGCITMNEGDKLRFVNIPEPHFEAVRQVVQYNWPYGIQRVRPYGQSLEIKLGGYPWKASYKGSDKARKLVRVVLETMYNFGWVLQAPVDVCRTQFDKGKF